MRAISARIWTRSFASRFESGSSIRNACGLAHDRAAHRDALALPAREVARPLRQHLREAEHLGAPPRRAAGSRLVDAAHLQPERHVLVDVHVRVERVVLEDHRHVARLRRQVVDDLRRRRGPSPPVISSRPAIIRSAVVLPQPDGPTKTTNSPSSTSRSSSWTARVPSA